jgi:hypothetical protein
MAPSARKVRSSRSRTASSSSPSPGSPAGAGRSGPARGWSTPRASSAWSPCGWRNIGREPQNLHADAQHLYDADDNRYQVAYAATAAGSPQLLTAPRLNPGIEVSGTLVYDVPASFRPLRLELHDSPLSGGRSLLLA